MSTIVFDLPPITAAKAKAMFKVSDDGKLRVRDPRHKEFEGSKAKALDYVIKVNGDGKDMDPESLLHACVDKDDTIELTLQRDLGNNICRRERKCNCLCSCRFCNCLNRVLGKESQTTGLPDGRTAEGAGARHRASGEGDDRGAE